MLSQEELALLEAISESGSLSRAAARLGKAPSTVSHAARQLETRFDALLFDRRRYRLQLTPYASWTAADARSGTADAGCSAAHPTSEASGFRLGRSTVDRYR